MNKEDILTKSRKGKQDEGIEFAENKGRLIGVIIISIIYVFILIVNMSKGNKTSFEMQSLFWGFSFGDSLPKYRFTRNKLQLAKVIISAIFFIMSISSYIVEVLR